MNTMKKIILLLLIASCAVNFISAQYVILTHGDMLALTPEWEGERFPDGRPRVPDQLLNRVKKLTLEQIWAGLRRAGYENQFAGDWTMIHQDQPIVGRALTAQYMPQRLVVRQVLEEQGKKDGRIGNMVSWPIDELSEGDLYVADSYGKMNEGPIIGDNLATAIYANSKNGVVFNGTLRDLEGMEDIEGFNAFVKGWHPSHQMQMMLTGINVPIRIDEATVMPGDVVLAKREGVMFIPPHLVQQIVIRGEFTALNDDFGHQRLREGKYTPGQIDGKWTDDIKKDFLLWLNEHPEKLPMPREELDEYLKTRDW